MQFAWDPAKNTKNIAKHGIDFLNAVQIFAAPVLVYRSDRNDEERYTAVGMLGAIAVTVIYMDRETEQGTVRRIISARRARKNEIKAYNEARRS